MKRTFECECLEGKKVDFDDDGAFCPTCKGYVKIVKLHEMSKFELIEKYIKLWHIFETMLHNETVSENLYCTDKEQEAKKIDCFKLNHYSFKEHTQFYEEAKYILKP